MFTGIVESMARVEAIVPRGQAYRFTLDLGALAPDIRIGDSVAVSGTCLTAVGLRGSRVDFDVIRETVERTAFATLRVGERVNIERSMRADGRFHGHFVAGHVDGTGQILHKREEPGQITLSVETSPQLTAFMIEKGSIALDGVSLTLTAVEETQFSVALIPHTLSITSLGPKTVGNLLNIEVDQLGKWVCRLLTAYVPTLKAAQDEGPKIIEPKAALNLTIEQLRRAGFGSS